MSPYRHIRPGEREIIKILMDPDDWEGISELERKGMKRFKARAIYKNGPTKLYSPYYDVTFE